MLDNVCESNPYPYPLGQHNSGSQGGIYDLGNSRTHNIRLHVFGTLNVNAPLMNPNALPISSKANGPLERLERPPGGGGGRYSPRWESLSYSELI